MAQANLLQLAQAGDADAIAALMNASLQAIGVSARAVLRDGNLHVLLESERLLNPSPSIEFIRRGLMRLGLAWLSTAVVYSRLVGQNSPVWVEQVFLNPPTLAVNPFELQGDLIQQAFTLDPVVPAEPWWKRYSPLTLGLMLSVPMIFLLSSGIIWFRFIMGDRVATPAGQSTTVTQVNTPPSGADLLAQAKDRGYAAYQRGLKAANQQDWHAVAGDWRAAIALLKTVPKSDPAFAAAQAKLAEYQGHLDHVIRVKLSAGGMDLVKTITGGLSPKSVVASGKGLFFAQNMMYSHTVNVYDRQYRLVKTMPDAVKLADYGYAQYPGVQKGAPVEAAFSPDGKTAWVSNYQMYGAGFSSAADDDCSPSQNHDPSFLYRIGTGTLAIDKVVQVGAVPKYVETMPSNRYVLVSNWCSWDLSIVDPQQNKEIKRISLGPYPRGIAVDPRSQTAYVAIMGSYDIAAVNLSDFSVQWLRDIGHSPRHLNMDPAGRFLYATLNGAGQIAKIDLTTKDVVGKVATGSAPRSMAISGDGSFLYVVNYDSDTVSKVRTADLQVVKTVNVNAAPIGITYDNDTHQVWVASYSGSIQVFQD